MAYFGGHATLGDVAHYWEMDEASGSRTSDVSAFTFSDFNTVTRETGNGPKAYAARFTRANSEILYRDSTTFHTSFSISCWVYPITDPGASYVGIHGFGSGFPTAIILAVYRVNTSPGSLVTLCADTAGGYQYTLNTGASYNLNYNAWNWLLVTYDETDKKIRSRINGTATQTSTALAATRYNTAQQWDVGYCYLGGSTSPYFDGRITEYGYWGRALTESEMDSLWNSGSGLFLRSPETATKTGSTAATSVIGGDWLAGRVFTGNTAAQSVVSGRSLISMYKTGSTANKTRVGGRGVINWADTTGLSLANDTLTKTAGVSWTNAGSFSKDYIASGEDGYIEYVVPASPGYVMFGLSNADVNQNFNTINYALYYYPPTGAILFYENGTYVGQTGAIGTGAVLRLAVVSGVVKGYVNGNLVWTSATPPTFPLYCDTSFYDTGATLPHPVIYNGRPNAYLSGSLKSGATAAQSTVNGPRVSQHYKAGAVAAQSTLDAIMVKTLHLFGDIAAQSAITSEVTPWINYYAYLNQFTNRKPEFETKFNKRAVYPGGRIKGWRGDRR